MTISMLTVLPTDETTVDIGAPPAHEEWIRADTLRPWRIQRPLNNAMVRKIAREFDPDELHHLLVTRRDGVNYLLDGQHRWSAIVHLLGWGAQNVPCLVYEGLTDAQEAKLFYAQAPGMRRPLSALHAFNVLVQSGDPLALRIVATVEAVGLHLSLNNAIGNDMVVAVNALRRVTDLYGIDRLETTLRMLKTALGPEARAYTSDMILGYAAFLVRYEDDYDPQEMIRKIRPLGPDGLIRQARNLQAALGGSITTAIGRALHQIYNGSKRSRRLADWQDHYRAPDVAARRSERISNAKVSA